MMPQPVDKWLFRYKNSDTDGNNQKHDVIFFTIALEMLYPFIMK